MVVGGDFSRHNTEIPEGLGFIWLKATEGKTYVDPKLNDHITTIAARGHYATLPVMGFYHFARPDNNGPEEEAKHYLDVIEPHVGKCLMALDWEVPEITNEWTCDKQYRWANDFMDYIVKKTGVTPLFYTSRYVAGSFAHYFRGFLSDRLWLADYNGAIVSSVYEVKPVMQQMYTTPFDIDIFRGTREELVKLALPKW